MRAVKPSLGYGMACVLSLASLSTNALSIESSFSGFATLVAGRSFGDCRSSTMSSTYASECTRYIADWSHAGVYTGSWSASEESRAGVQWDAKLTPDLASTVQLTGRLSPGQKAAVEWAYLSYSGVKDWTFQLGRKRLPLYYYSDFQDVGYAYNTVRPAPDVYGWDVVNYNGASARYQTRSGEWSFRQDVFAGGESSKNNPYQKLITTDKTTTKWTNIVGASLEMNRDWFTTRITYVKSNFSQTDAATGEKLQQASGDDHGTQQFYGVALNGDFDDWIVRSEFDIADRSKFAYKSRFFLVNVGYRVGSFIPTLGMSSYSESTPFPDAYATIKNRTYTGTLRYDINGRSDLKIQFDRVVERSETPFMGSSKAIAIAYDIVY